MSEAAAADRTHKDAPPRERIKALVAHLAHMLSEQGPMNITFVHNNTLLGLQKLHFHDAIEKARQVLGLEGYETPQYFRNQYAQGRINNADLEEAVAALPGIEPGAVIAELDGQTITRSALIQAVLRHDLHARPSMPVLERVFDPEAGALGLGPESERLVAQLDASGADALKAELDQVGPTSTLGEWLGGLLGIDLVGAVRRALTEDEDDASHAEGTRALREMGIDPRHHEAYRHRAGQLWPRLPLNRALAVEARWVAEIAERHLASAGDLYAIRDRYLETPAAFSARALFRAACRSLGVPAPLGPSLPLSLVPRAHATLVDHGRVLSDDELRSLREVVAVTGAPSPALISAVETAVISAEAVSELRGLLENGADEDQRARLSSLLESNFDAVHRDAMIASANAFCERVGAGSTLGELVESLTGESILRRVDAHLVRFCAAFTDEGLATWRLPERHLGLFAAWRRFAESDLSLDLEAGGDWRDELARLPESADEALAYLVERAGIREEHWEAYIGRSLAQLKGWAGMMFWLQTHPNHYKQKVQPADTVSYLAIRLFLEKVLSGPVARERLGVAPSMDELRDWAQRNRDELYLRVAQTEGRALPEVVQALAQFPASTPRARPLFGRLSRRQWLHDGAQARRADDARRALNLYRLAAHFRISAGVLAEARSAAESLVNAVDLVTARDVGRVWLEAFEAHYRDEVLNALVQNKDRGRWIKGREKRPRSQVVFCIDEREENLHRYYGELDPDHETLGAAGFFGVAIAHNPLGDHSATPLCPAVVTPAHRVAEVPRDEALETSWPVAKRRRHLQHAVDAVAWELKRNPIASFFAIQLTGWLSAMPLFGRVFAPLGFHRIAELFQKRIVPPVPTKLTHLRLADTELARYGLSGKLPFGFSVTEAADRVEVQLRNWGLIDVFAPIVVICAHRSFSVNNPHENAHDCGACGGKAGGPNARLFAALANDRGVRDELANRGIRIPDDTWFVGAEHNTCSDEILCFDTDDIPAALQEKWALVSKDLDETSRRAARERCRRFRISPKDASPDRSWEHVRGRSQDLSQVRPEWGHATNAFALVGRRALTQGLFFDRRGFIISYDPTTDADGKIVERILMAVGPVGAGINLEYYFSTVNPDGYGSGTKVPHNVVGMIGVMAGAQGDLATGLPRQMTEVHEAMRLQLIVDAPMAVLGEIYGRQPAIQELLNGQWVHLIAHEPSTREFHRFVPGVGFVKWDKPLKPLPEVPDSYSWIQGKHNCFLPPARIREPTRRWDA